MQSELQRGFRLHDRTVLPEQNRISGGGEDTHVVPRTMAVLVCLAEHAGEVVTREFMDEHVWRGSVVTDHALTSCISELRNHLGDARGEPRFIETVPKRGYRLIAPVTPLEDEAEPEARPPPRSLWRIALPLGLALVVVVIAGFWWVMHNGSETGGAGLRQFQHVSRPTAPGISATVAVSAGAPVPAAEPIPAKSIAVLPFANLSDDKKNEYFVAGMQDMILTKLADIGDLKVVSRTSTEDYSSHPGNLDAIGRRLGVATILEGSVQKAGNQVLINVQLIDAKTDSHLWAQSYQRNLGNIFGVEGEVAAKVADALSARLTATEAAAVAHVPTTNPQAYDDYLRGLHFDNVASKGDWTKYLPQAIAAYQKAVAEDPDFALAWAALSNARGEILFWAGDRSQANLLAAEAAAKRALKLDPQLPEAHLAMAGIERFLHHDLVAAHDQVQQAVELRPNDADALGSLSTSEANLGYVDAAIRTRRRAIALNPTDSFMRFELGWGLASNGDYAGARQAEHRALAIDPQNAMAYLALSQIEISQNLDVKAATEVLDHMAPGTPMNAMLATWRIDLLLFRRQFNAARSLAEKYAGKFLAGPAAVDMTFARANIEWLAGKTDDARAFYRAGIALMKPGSEISAMGHARLGLAYARLGDAKAAMKASDEALAMAVKSHKYDAPQGVKYVLAETQLALGNKSASVDTLAEVLSMDPRDIRAPWLLFLARMQLAPTWDPIRNDTRFQALLKKYPAPVSASTSIAVSARAPAPTLTAGPIPAKSIAVLPFENLSDDKQNEYFVAGMQDVILTKLADIGDLKVIARTSTEKYASHPDNLKAIGQQLGVATFLEGSVQKSGKQVLINVQLIDADSDAHIWAQSYTRTLDNIFGVEGDVAGKVAKALDAKLTEAEAARVAAVPTTNSAAYDAYLRGEFHMTQFGHGEMKPEVAAAVREYSDAVEQDPKFALAWARLAVAQVFLGAMTYDNPGLTTKLRARAKVSIANALKLQSTLAEAHVSQGIYDLFARGDRNAALKAFQTAHSLQPQNAAALWWVAYALGGLDRTNEAMPVLQQLRVVDPARAYQMLGVYDERLGQVADAERALKRALAIHPDSWVALRSLAALYAYRGDLPSMGKLIEGAPAGIKSNPNFTDTVGDYFFYRRDWAAARKLFAQAKEPQNLHAAFYPIEIKRGDVEWYAGNRAAARVQYQRVIPLLEAQLKQRPKSRLWHSELGWVYARLGRDGEALREGRLALGPQDPTAGVVRHSPENALALARIEAQIGKASDAIAILDTLLAEPTGTLISVPLLKLDPTWDPIRHDPRFQTLLKKYSQPAPASTSAAAPATASST